MTWLDFPHKTIRARVIAEYLTAADVRGCVVFGCGNAAAALRAAGVYVVDVSPAGDLAARRWWTAAEIRRAWPDLLDATCGHLSAPLLAALAAAYRAHLGVLADAAYTVPTGSGETLVCLAAAYPAVRFLPAYDLDDATRWAAAAPLNGLVAALVARPGGLGEDAARAS